MFSRFFNIDKNTIIIIIIKIIKTVIINITSTYNKVTGASNNSIEASFCNEKAVNTRSEGIINVNVRGFSICEKRDRNHPLKTVDKLRVGVTDKKNGGDR